MILKYLILFENPLTAEIEERNLEFQVELCDLQNDMSLKMPEKGNARKEFFLILGLSNYPKLINFDLQIFSMFNFPLYMNE